MAPWVNGVKTGHTFDAGYVLVGSGRRKGVELISVAIGAPTDEDRFDDNLELLEYGFSPVPAAGADPRRPGPRRPVDPLRRRRAAAARRPHASRSACAAASGSASTSTRPREVEGPIRRGAVLGHATVFVDGLPGRDGAAARRSRRSRGERSSTAPAASSAITRFLLALAAFVILIGGVLLCRRLSGATTRGAKPGEAE